MCTLPLKPVDLIERGNSLMFRGKVIRQTEALLDQAETKLTFLFFSPDKTNGLGPTCNKWGAGACSNDFSSTLSTKTFGIWK